MGVHEDGEVRSEPLCAEGKCFPLDKSPSHWSYRPIQCLSGLRSWHQNYSSTIPSPSLRYLLVPASQAGERGRGGFGLDPCAQRENVALLFYSPCTGLSGFSDACAEQTFLRARVGPPAPMRWRLQTVILWFLLGACRALRGALRSERA